MYNYDYTIFETPNSRLEQRQAISAYEKQMNDELDLFKTMDAPAVNRWCVYDLKKRGAIL